MPSSTSNSKLRAPGGPWLKTWVCVLVLLVLAQAGWRTYWTSQGFVVALPNDPSRWADNRWMMKPESTVLLGTSRMQAGLVPEEWAAEMDGELPLQLALVGTSPLPIMKHLAQETDYHGLVVMGVTEMTIFDAEPEHDRAARALAEYQNVLTSPSRRSSIVLGRYVPESILVRHRRLNLRGILTALWNRNHPRNPAGNMRADRWFAFEADRVTPEDLDYDAIAKRGRPATVAERDSIISELEDCIQTIQSRGGKVVFVVFPACETRREIEERRYPRDMYWNALVKATSAVAAINTYDYPQFLDIQCSDGSHLDESDARWLTRELARLIKQQL